MSPPKWKTIAIATAWLAATPTPLMGQEIVAFNVPTHLCAGDTATVDFGYNTDHNIVIEQAQSSMGHSEVVFLPDGEECGSRGCSYRSPVTFSDFSEGATISSANDIKYIRLNMEHSYIGDLYINVTCPNGQKADILKYSNQNQTIQSACISSIGNASKGWNASPNNVIRAYLGIPNLNDDLSWPCQHTSYTNAPGTGWNYCWSNNTNSGYSYASDGGYIYRESNQTYVGNNRNRVDSSHVAAGTNYYHPDQSFANLVGCPLNGEWYIEVIDGVSQDNGYIFEWELVLDPDLLPPEECLVTGYSIDGHGVSAVNDSSFTIAAPQGLNHDTTMAYTYTIHSSCGDIDSTVNITIHPTYAPADTIEGCDQVLWHGTSYTATSDIVMPAVSRHGCDSTVSARLIVHPSYHLTQTASVVENDLPYSLMGHDFYNSVADTLLTNTTAYGCDSNVTFSLTVYRNVATNVDTMLCSDAIPLLWNGLALSTSTDTAVTLATSHGADSVVTLHMAVHPTYDSLIFEEVVENQLPVTILGQPRYTPLDTTIHYNTLHGCDSTVTYRLIIHANHAYRYTHTICDDALPYSWNGTLFPTADSIVLDLTDQYGADSTVTLILSVNPAYDIHIDTTICDNHPYLLDERLLDTSGVYNAVLTTMLGCDSAITLNLTVKPHNETTIYDTICNNDHYTFGENTYNRTGIYTYSYTNIYGCDSTVTLNLGIMAEDLHAAINASPLLVTPTHPDFQLHDNSVYAASWLWIIQDNEYTQRSLTYTFPDGLDSLPVHLVAYSPEGCTDTAHALILIDRSTLFTPNAFTPAEANNNIWRPVLNDIGYLEVWIYSRTGLLVNHLQGVDLGWDGKTADGTACPQGAYVYSLHYRTIHRPEKLQTLTGTILLIR